MALANVADVFARRGLRTAMIDFDLEAPGLERFFLSDPTPVRRNLGLLDLLLAYKQAMSVSPSEGEPEFRNLGNFIVPIYRQLPSGGKLDLLPAGQRADDEQLATYAYHLRTFDWQEFYFEWFGEVFFQWLRRELMNRYDVILVDSRTGMTEMGGVCAYQLADHMVMFCAANSQNVQGTRDIIRNFQSPRVQALRKDRPLDVLVVPARVQQSGSDVERFRSEFEKSFGAFTPPTLEGSGQTLWGLMLPYVAAYAFEERLVASDAEGVELRSAFERLAETVALLAPAESALRTMTRHERGATSAPVFDPTRRFAGYDAFLSYSRSDEESALRIARHLADRGLKIWLDLWELKGGEPLMAAIERALDQSRAFVVLIGPAEAGLWRKTEERLIFERSLRARDDFRLIPVLLPGTTFESIPEVLRSRLPIDFRASLDDFRALKALVAAILGEVAVPRPSAVESDRPYKGLATYQEEDAAFFFGRAEETDAVVRLLFEQNFVAVVGPSGSGKTSLVQAGVIPRLRQKIPGVQVVFARPGLRPTESLAAALEPVADLDAAEIEKRLLDRVPVPLRRSVLLVIDQLEEIWQHGVNAVARSAFLLAMRTLIGSCRVVVLLRADFYASALEEGFGDFLSIGQVNLRPMSRDALRAAIERPALIAGMAFEPGLVERLLNDAEGSRTPLPLLQVVLYEMWHRSQRTGQGFLTHAAYDEVGAVGTTLARWADAIYDSLTLPERVAAKSALLRMITSELTRRSVPYEEFREEEWAILKRLVDRRLVVLEARNETTIATIAHDSLVRDWPRLAGWLEESHEYVRLRSVIREAALEWTNNGRDCDFLYRGRALAAAERLLRSAPYLVGPREQEFLLESRRATGLFGFLRRLRR